MRGEKTLPFKRNVYMTVLTNDTYILGVKALKRSLRNTKCKYDLVILVPQNEEKNLRSILEKKRILDKHCVLHCKENIIIQYPENVIFESHYWSNTFFKLSVANCTEFEKIILLDSDMLILHNLDHLFEKPHYSAAVAGHCAVPEWVKLNSGLMVINPSEQLYTNLLNSIQPAMYRRFHEGNNIGDQDVFQEAYKDWEEHKDLLLSEQYNCFFENVRILAREERIKLNDIAVIHFAGKRKPWSDGCLTKHNIRQCISYFYHGYYYELKIFMEYLLFAAL